MRSRSSTLAHSGGSPTAPRRNWWESDAMRALRSLAAQDMTIWSSRICVRSFLTCLFMVHSEEIAMSSERASHRRTEET
jgi:hypothetical protein